MSRPYVTQTPVASSVPFDNTPANGYSSTDVQGALQELRDHTVFDSRTQATTLNGTLTLTSADLNLQYFTGTQTGYSVQMPSALTIPAGSTTTSYYQLINTSNQNITVKDGSGATLLTLSQSSIAFLWLSAGGSAGGTWVWFQNSTNVASGIVSYNVTSSTNFSSSAAVDTLITGMSVVPQAGTYGIWTNYQLTGTGAGQQVDTTLYNGASAIADSKRSNLSTSGTHIFSNSTMTIAQFNGTNACALYINPNGNSFTVGARNLLLIRLGA
jgi:hypothetical protein